MGALVELYFHGDMTIMSSKLPDGKTMRDGQIFSARLNNVVTTEREFDELVTKSLPELLDRATGQTKRFLRETNQWGDDITHEKLALRWGYELVERFVVFGRTEVPCRPFFLLDSLIAKSFQSARPALLSQGAADAGGTVSGRIGLAGRGQPRRLDRAVLSLLWVQSGPCGEVTGLRPGRKPAGL